MNGDRCTDKSLKDEFKVVSTFSIEILLPFLSEGFKANKRSFQVELPETTI